MRSDLRLLPFTLALSCHATATAEPLALFQGKGMELSDTISTVDLRSIRDGAISAARSCRSPSLVIEGIRSSSEPGAGWQLFLTAKGPEVPAALSDAARVSTLNFYGTSRVGALGRKVSFPIDPSLIARLASTRHVDVPLQLHLAPTKRPTEGSHPRLGLVALWCLD